MPKWVERIYYVLSFLFLGSSYMSPYTYGLLHRMHHAYADTEKDPHSPDYSRNAFSLMWKTFKYYSDIHRGKIKVDSRFDKDLPKWEWFDKFASSYITKIAWGGVYLGFYIIFATEWWMFLLVPLHFVMGPIHGTVINFVAHRVGYRNYEVNDKSKNIMFWDIFMLGEGYHNNHHTHASSPNFARKWYEFDPIYPTIKLQHWLGLIKLRGK